MSTSLEAKAREIAQAEVVPKTLRAAQETANRVKPGQKAMAYEMKREQEYERLYPEAFRRAYAELVRESLK